MLNRVQIRQLAEAYEAVAKVNHYMVGIIEPDLTQDDMDAAEQVLITRQNAAKEGGTLHKRLDLALDLLAYHRDALIRHAA